MTKTTAPLFGFDALGSIADTTTYSKWKGQNYAKQFRRPANPKSPAQETARGTLRTANAIWKAAPALFKATWNVAAVPRRMTGYTVFLGAFIEGTHGDPNLLGMPFAARTNGGMPLTVFVLTPGSAQVTVGFGLAIAPPGWSVQSMIGAVIPNGDPALTSFFEVTAGEDTVAPYSVVLTGLLPSTIYAGSAWLKWTKADGTTAYGESLPVKPVTTLP